MFKFCISAAGALLAAAPIHAQASIPLMQVSIGVREVGVGLPFPGLGADGGFSGGIEWINLDGLVLPLDGMWYQFTFRLATDPITGFAGSTANGTLDGNWGTLEHIRIKNFMDFTGRVSLHIDDIEVTTTPAGGAPTTMPLEDFETWLAGDEVMFQEPCYSGSTDRNMAIYDPGLARCVQTPQEITHQSGVDTAMGHNMSFASYNATFRFLASTPPAPHAAVSPGSRWLRMTSYQTLNRSNPAVPFNNSAEISFWMRGEAGSKVEYSGACPGVLHSMGGPLLTYTGSAALNDNLVLQGNNLIGALCALLVGTVIDPGIPVDLIGGLPGSKLCVAEFAQVGCLGQNSVSLTLPIGNDPTINGLVFGAQIIDFDPSGTASLPIGFSDTILFSPGNF